jgi:hypothetical protein
MSKRTGAELLDSGQRFAVTMWEYSWLVQRGGLKTRAPVFGPEDEYRDWDRVLDELVERGYDCVRIDAHPHLVAASPGGQRQETFTMLPVGDRFMWGNHEPVVVEPRRGLVDFMKKCAARGIYVGLSSWFNDDETHRKRTIETPADYVRIWTETLDFLAAEDLLDLVVWVDVCNEFPLPGWAPKAFDDIFGPRPAGFDSQALLERLREEWSHRVAGRFGEYMAETVAGLKAAHPELRYTFSFCLAAENITSRIDVGALDLLEPHIWTTDDLAWAEESGMVASERGAAGESLRAYVARVRELYPASRERCRAILDRLTDLWSGLAARTKLPLVTTEAWTMVLYEDVSPGGAAGEWEWFKDIAEIGVRMAIDKGWQGICTSNFCEPHFEGMWQDVAWHRRMTDLIKG